MLLLVFFVDVVANGLGFSHWGWFPETGLGRLNTYSFLDCLLSFEMKLNLGLLRSFLLVVFFDDTEWQILRFTHLCAVSRCFSDPDDSFVIFAFRLGVATSDGQLFATYVICRRVSSCLLFLHSCYVGRFRRGSWVLLEQLGKPHLFEILFGIVGCLLVSNHPGHLFVSFRLDLHFVRRWQ